MKKPNTRQKILDAALRLLETSGIKGLSQPAVAKIVGISQGQLTYHFQKRTDLVIAVTQCALDQVADFLWSQNPELAGRSFEKLLDLVVTLMKSDTRVRALLGLVVEADENEDVRTKLMDQGEKVRTLIATALQIDPTDPEVTIAHAAMLGYAILFFMQRDRKKRALLEEHFKDNVKILIEHLKVKKTKRRK
jgi:AcrR family transcriptional regulator